MKKILLFLSVILILSGCDKETDSVFTINTTPKNLYAGDSLQLDVSSTNDVSYSVENEYYASVSDKGLIKARKVGTTIVNVSSGEEIIPFSITVKAKEYLYKDPQLDWDMNSSEVISALGLTKDDVKFTGNNFAIKDYSFNAYLAMFLFDDTTNKLISYMICVDSYKLKQALAFLQERYYFIDYNSDGAYFIDTLPNDIKTCTKCISVISELKHYNNKYIFQILYLKIGNKTKACISEKNTDKTSYEKLYNQLINKLNK